MLYILGYDDSIANIPGTSIHIYSLLMATGFLTATISSWIKMYRRKIPTKTLEWGVLIIAIAGLLGARVWFVLNNTKIITSVLDVFAVWNGGMAIEGGVLTGLIVGFFIFYRASKQLEISMWIFIDCIIPNILLGQAIGRWGNFFNQELLGADVGHPFSFLPTWMNDHLHYVGNKPDHVEVYRQPLFLYESITSLIGWLFLILIVPKTGQCFSKKPWKLFPEKFKSPLSQNPITKQEFCFQPWKVAKKFYLYHKWKKQIWNKTYFEFEPPRNIIKNIIKKPLKNVKIKMEDNWKKKMVIYFKNKYRWIQYQMQPKAKVLHNSYNPNNYRVTYAGVAGSLYFAFYGIVRIIMEPLRDSRDIMMISGIPTTMIVSAIWIIFGLTLAIFAQFICPSRFRKGEWLYERTY